MLIGGVLSVMIPRLFGINEKAVLYQWGIPTIVCAASALTAEMVVLLNRVIMKWRKQWI